MGTSIKAFVGYGLKRPAAELEKLIEPHGGADELFVHVGATNPQMEILWQEGRSEAFIGYLISEVYADEGQSINEFDLTPTIVSYTIDTLDRIGFGGKSLGLHLIVEWL